MFCHEAQAKWQNISPSILKITIKHLTKWGNVIAKIGGVLFANYNQNSYETISTTALVYASVIFVSILSHAFKNRKINPIYGKYFK